MYQVPMCVDCWKSVGAHISLILKIVESPCALCGIGKIASV